MYIAIVSVIIVVVSFIGMYCLLVSRGNVFLAKLHHPLDGVALLHSWAKFPTGRGVGEIMDNILL